MVLVVAGVTISVGWGGFQNVRKLAPFYPFWALIMLLGVDRVCHTVAQYWRPPSQRGYVTLVCAVGIIALQGATYGETVRETYLAVRDAGAMRNYLVTHGIDRILVLPNNYATQLLPDQGNLRVLSVAEADHYEHITFQWLIRYAHGDALMDCLAALEPLAAFPNQASLTMYRFEAPLRESFLDTAHPLTHQRTLFAWPAVRDRCLEFMRKQGYFARAGDRGTGPIVTEPGITHSAPP